MKLAILGIYKEYNAKNDTDLLKKMANDALTINCIVCKKKMKIDKAIYVNGDPYCKKHAYV
jgi:hypothetical protein